jgi:hypothetical protein
MYVCVCGGGGSVCLCCQWSQLLRTRTTRPHRHKQHTKVQGLLASSLTLFSNNCWRASLRLRRDKAFMRLWGLISSLVGALLGILYWQQVRPCVSYIYIYICVCVCVCVCACHGMRPPPPYKIRDRRPRTHTSKQPKSRLINGNPPPIPPTPRRRARRGGICWGWSSPWWWRTSSWGPWASC